MRIIQIINEKKFMMLGIFFFFYLFLNLLDGERGLISYFEKKKIEQQLINKKILLSNNLYFIEKKNQLLTNTIDLDYLEILYRKNFAVGKKNEKLFTINR